ncbi:MAG: ABC transporter permease [Bacteroidota bacterium]|nr:ABC transporter permease [Bacteroidota bacterium]
MEERLRHTHPLRRILARPELGALGGAVAVWAFFAIIAGDQGFLSLRGTATYLEVAAELGILAAAVALLMIGGEFDLSVGSIIGASGMLLTVLAVQFGWNIWLAFVAVMAFAVLAGLFNGIMVVKTGLPSFIVTLATLFVFRGATIAITRLVTGRTQLGGLQEVPGYSAARWLFAGEIPFGSAELPVSIIWWIVLTALATWILLRTPFGNWIFGAGGDARSASSVGVPVPRVKVLLFVGTALAAALVGVIQSVGFNGADVLRGELREFFAIIVVVIGGTLLTGGYGSAIGAAIGALIFGMVRQGIVFAGVDADWFQVFLGAMLLIAVLVNHWVRRRALKG